MSPTADRIISRVVDSLTRRPGVRGIALVGSRAHPDRSRVDPYSDADFLVCCEDDERERLLAGDWIPMVGPPVLVFPRIMTDEIRVLFQDLFACELHLLTLTELEHLTGPCRIGSYIGSAFAVLHDPDGHLRRLASRVRPEPPEERDPAVASSVFWYDAAYCANLVLRGDLFRASQFTNWYLQLFLLELFFSIEEPDATKYVARKLPPAQYEALARTVSPLTRESMIVGLRRCMRCYWQFQNQVCPDIDPALLSSYRSIEQEIERRFDGTGAVSMDVKEQMDQIYRDLSPEEIPWNAERPPELLVELIKSRRVLPCRAVDLGCGAGNYAIWLAAQGFDVTGVDISVRALELAARNAAVSGVTCRFVAADLLGDVKDLEGAFEFAYDWEVLHHIFPPDRPRYVANVHRMLRPGARYLSVCFSEEDPGFGGEGKYRTTPLGTRLYFSSEQELRELFEPLFRVEELAIAEVAGKRLAHKVVRALLSRS